jgi:hypothetical protein
MEEKKKQEIERLGLEISEILNNFGNPYSRVEITSEGVEVISTDSFCPRKKPV